MSDSQSGGRARQREEFLPEEGGSFEPNLVFVALPFGTETAAQAYMAIADECGRLGLRASRVEASAGASLIKQTTNLIRRAEFLIFDLTDEEPAVCYGLGYAHGSGNESLDILLLAREEASLSFDPVPLAVHRYSALDDLPGIVSAGLEEMMQQTRR